MIVPQSPPCRRVLRLSAGCYGRCRRSGRCRRNGHDHSPVVDAFSLISPDSGFTVPWDETASIPPEGVSTSRCGRCRAGSPVAWPARVRPRGRRQGRPHRQCAPRRTKAKTVNAPEPRLRGLRWRILAIPDGRTPRPLRERMIRQAMSSPSSANISPGSGSLDGDGSADHDQPYRFGFRPRASAPYPFNTRQYARLLVLRGHIQDHLGAALEVIPVPVRAQGMRPAA
jgi:hypothetical protein